MLSNLAIALPDPLWALVAAYRADPRPGKMDLVIGVYRDASGETPVMDAVKAAEAQLAAAGASKTYRSLSGNAAFNSGMAKLLLGEDRGRLSRQHTMQTVGGTGALRLLADLVAVAAPAATVWTSDPGYINHRPIFTAAGLAVSTYRWQERGGAVDASVMLDDLAKARAGDIVLLHGCCHNPTGIDMPLATWAAVAHLCATRGLVPLVDMAYQGFGDGMEADAEGLRTLVDSLDTVLLASSASKNMGLYCERTGAATVIGANEAALRAVGGTMERITRANYSMAPDHGAAIAAALFANPTPWLAELEGMRLRIAGIRAALGDALARFGAADAMQDLRHHKGMFSLLPVSAEMVTRLRQEFAIYGTQNGRINIAGLLPSQIESLAAALAIVSAGREVSLSQAA
jgi:aspartate aminotransferase